MFLGTVASGATQEYSIEKPVKGLRISVPITFDGATTTPVQKLAALRGMRDNVTITYNQIDKEGRKVRPATTIPMSLIFEYWQRREGYVSIMGNVLTAIVPFSTAGSLVFKDDQNLNIKINHAGNSIMGDIKVNTMHSHIRAGHYLDYTRLTIDQNKKEKSFNVTDYDVVAIPMDSSLITATTEFRVKYTNGLDDEFFFDTLSVIGVGLNDCVYNVDGLVLGGYGAYAFIKVKNATTLELERESNAAYDIFAITENPVDNLAEVIEINESLTATNNEKFEEAIATQLM